MVVIVDQALHSSYQLVEIVRDVPVDAILDDVGQLGGRQRNDRHADGERLDHGER